jgi:hypothetical protein
MMEWYLFLDDIRTLEQANVSYSKDQLVLIARNMDDAIFYVERYGIPQAINFDHDLAEENYVVGQGDRTGYDFALWLCDYILDNSLDFPKNFYFTVHSMNPVGKEKIIGYMNNFMKHLEEERNK